MTNTLHRYGDPESLKDDYIVFIMASKGRNDLGAAEKIRTFFNTAIKFEPVNMGETDIGTLYQPEKDLNFFKLYLRGRREKRTPQELINKLENPDNADLVFDNKEALQGFLKEVQELDLGLSVNVSALVDDVREVCSQNGRPLHSVEYSLGFHGALDRLPDRNVLKLCTMCGHGMVSAGFTSKMIARVKEDRVTPEKAAGYMAKFCVCGIFNTTRAIRILNEIRTSN